MLTDPLTMGGPNEPLYTVGRSGLVESFVIPRGDEANAGAVYSANEQSRDLIVLVLFAVLLVGGLLFLKR